MIVGGTGDKHQKTGSVNKQISLPLNYKLYYSYIKMKKEKKGTYNNWISIIFGNCIVHISNGI